MLDIIGRFLFVVWIGCGLFGIFSVIAGWNDLAVVGLGTFAGIIVFFMLYHLAKWIITGKSD